MGAFVEQLSYLIRSVLDRQPTLALALGAALVTVFLVALLRNRTAGDGGLGITVYRQLCRLVWAVTLVALVAGAATLWQSYLHRVRDDFRHSHGRLTETNLQAVRTIWGGEQEQGELRVQLWWEEEQTERIESEDLSKPAVLRKKTVHHNVSANPFLTTRHEVELRQNPRKKGSAIYAGYETDCRFTWLLRNPTERDLDGLLRFPLPADGAMYQDLTFTLNGTNALPRLRVADGALVLDQGLRGGETLDVEISFKSRGLNHWYFQVRESREVRDFELLLRLPDLAPGKLNYPESCMTPTEITPAGKGSVLAYRLDRALCNKGMGVAMPKLKQPGELTGAVLAEAEKGWVLLFAAVVLGGTLATGANAALLAVLIASAMAISYGLVADASDYVFGFWGSAAIILVPVLVGLSWLVRRWDDSRWLVLQLVVFGLAYPCLAGLDGDRQTLYLNLSAGLLLLATGKRLLKNLS
jgi:hypothetical protein